MQIPDVPPQLLAAMVEAAAGQRLALVGGVVRDLLLHRHHQEPWRGLPDLDLVIEGRVADLVARLPLALEHHFGVPVPLRHQYHDYYGTVAVELQLPLKYGGVFWLDLASARQEHYLRAGDNPKISPTTIEKDLARRDLTINAMAIMLPTSERFISDNYELLDPFSGLMDLICKQIRFLHSDSLRDDPSRIFRACRYSARLGFVLTNDARKLIIDTINDWPWVSHPVGNAQSTLASMGTRLRAELEILLQSSHWQEGIKVLQQCEGLKLLDLQVQEDPHLLLKCHWAERFDVPKIIAVVISAENPITLAARLNMPHEQQTDIASALELCNSLREIKDEHLKPSEWCSIFERKPLNYRSVMLALIHGAQPRGQIIRWAHLWRLIKSPVTAKELLRQGWTPGPEISQELRIRRALIIDSQ